MPTRKTTPKADTVRRPFVMFCVGAVPTDAAILKALAGSLGLQSIAPMTPVTSKRGAVGFKADADTDTAYLNATMWLKGSTKLSDETRAALVPQVKAEPKRAEGPSEADVLKAAKALGL